MISHASHPLISTTSSPLIFWSNQVLENAGYIDVTVSRTNGTAGECSVDYHTEDGEVRRAREGED